MTDVPLGGAKPRADESPIEDELSRLPVELIKKYNSIVRETSGFLKDLKSESPSKDYYNHYDEPGEYNYEPGNDYLVNLLNSNYLKQLLKYFFLMFI